MVHVTRTVLIAAVLATLGGTACRSMGSADPAEAGPTTDLVSLRVTNENFSDVNVYLLRSGVQTRIGRVNAGATERFTLTPALLGPGGVDLVATPANGSGIARSGSLVVTGGQTIDFRIAPVISQSRAIVE